MSASARAAALEPGAGGSSESASAFALRKTVTAFSAAWHLATRPLFLKAALSAALVAGFLAGVNAVEKKLASLDRYRVDPGCLKIREMPAWLSPDWADSVGDPFKKGQNGNLFDPGLPQAVLEAYRKSPWIEEISSVRKQFPNRMSVMLKVRTPLAAVPWDGKLLLVDGHGVLLPVSFEKLPDFGFPLRVVAGVSSPPPDPGRRWESKSLMAGLKVAALLLGAGCRSFDRISRIDVSILEKGDCAGRTEILLFGSEGGGPIEWGMSPEGRRADLDIPLGSKLENLDTLLKACPDLTKVKYALVQFDEPRYAPVRQ